MAGARCGPFSVGRLPGMAEKRAETDGARPTGIRVVILHGARGGPDTNWFPWLQAELEPQGLEIVRPPLPTPHGQSLDAWFAAYDRAVQRPAASSSILVGHSLGAAFALRLAERSAEPFRAVYLAAGFVGALGLPDYDGINASFFERPFDWPGIRDRTGEARCWAGTDDRYVPLSRAEEVAQRLGAPLTVIAGGGHLDASSGFTTFPDLRNALLSTAGVADAGG
jgi:uncharacterized protein